MIHLCNEGMKRRYPDADEEKKKRLEYELSVIHKMGYVDYFLIVWDYINYAKTHGIAVGPGRGSAAGSIVSYCLGITDIDPIKYSLIFERFLNPERVSMPDIDVDFCYERRQEVIDYVVEKYGKDCVVQIVTFGTMAARAVIKDVGRVLDLPYAMVDNIAKMVPREIGITIDKAIQENPDLRNAYENDAQVHDLIDKSKRLEGLPRHASMHAAGVLISQKAVDEYVPVATGADGAVVAQFVMTTLEELGLLKMDFLGLRTLTVIQDAEKLARKKNPEFSIDNINYEDKNVYDMISTGKCEGIFQLESAGMKNFMKELKPQSIEDLIAGISLYRPGPMDFIPQYIKGKNNPGDITYDCPMLEPILKPTYGCIVYQEQVMQIVRDLAGYSLGRSDLVRRAMSKKKTSVMEKERQNFIYGNPEENVPGCISNGIDEKGFSGKTIGLVDERGEIAATYKGVAQNDVGIRTDIIGNVSKTKGIEMLIRSMAPDIIACDEIGSKEDILAIERAMISGVKGIFTMHGRTREDIKNNKEVYRLVENKKIEKIFSRYLQKYGTNKTAK